MYVVENEGWAITCMLVSLFLLGTFPAIFTLLERRGRLPQHTYLDYSFANLFTAIIIPLTLGQIGDSKPGMPNFITQLSQLIEDWPCVLFAMAGGIVLSLGNIAQQYALALVGLSVMQVIASSMIVLIGTTLNYFLDNRINNAKILFPGVACFFIAICLGSALHSSNEADNKAKLTGFSNSNHDGTGTTETPGIGLETSTDNGTLVDGRRDLENGSSHPEKTKIGTADFLMELENKRSIKWQVTGKSTIIGLGITFFAGACFSLFSPAFNLATNDQWHTMKAGVPHLVVYTAFFYFTLSWFIISIILTMSFLYYPILKVPKSSLTAYLKDCDGRLWALLAGLLCGLANCFQFMGGQAAGYATADSVQALPLVSTFWGILVFGEYRRSSKRTYVLLVSMLLMFSVAVGVLMASAANRKTS
ncbi:ureide permease 2-like [Telopea speciosissima]|uniref:ureide permease 2-like n=1 Tax=Telopea speciosissima TaxID=54955 RepID=UPI001CC366C9|nr:ureide permease 2-like [Telopea speciosissima]